MQLTNKQIALMGAYARERARDNLADYRKLMSNHKLIDGWFFREVSDKLQQFYIDYNKNKRPILIIQAPPQHGKSVAVVDAIEWMIGKNPKLRFIYTSFSDRLSIRANIKIQRTVEDPKFNATFPGVSMNDKRTVTVSGLQRNQNMVEFAAGGYFRNTTCGGPVTGESLDIGIIDDPLKGREEANSETIRNKRWEWFTNDFLTRFSDNAGLIIILTRWHTDDPVGRLLKMNPPGLTLVSYPAIAEIDEKHRNSGEALFPEHKSLDFLLSRKKMMSPDDWEALYQQNPQMPGGNMFKREWWQFWKALPVIDKRCMYIDTAQKDGQQNDYTVMQCWGKSSTGQAFLLDQIREKLQAPDLLVSARAFWDKHKGGDNRIGYLSKMQVEDKVSGTGLIQTLKREGIPVVPIQRDRDKVSRANDALPSIMAGNVYLPSDVPWLSDLLTELSSFPNGVHDDQVDPLVDAVVDMCLSAGTGIFGLL